MAIAGMFDRLFGNTVIPLLARVTEFTGARHRAIASNIANADTPGYRARDVSESEFTGQLRDAVRLQRRRPAAGFHVRASSHNRVGAAGEMRFEPIPAPDAGPAGARPASSAVLLVVVVLPVVTATAPR